MTIIGTHRGPISGLTHIHLLREPAATRKTPAKRDRAPAEDGGTSTRPVPERPQVTANAPLIR